MDDDNDDTQGEDIGKSRNGSLSCLGYGALFGVWSYETVK